MDLKVKLHHGQGSIEAELVRMERRSSIVYTISVEVQFECPPSELHPAMIILRNVRNLSLESIKRTLQILDRTL